MRTISLLLLVVISLASAANSRRFEIFLPQLAIPKPKSELIYTPQLNILIAINEAVHRGVGMRIHTNYTYPTEVVISKCGVPMLLIFEARTATGVISNEEVKAMHNFDCEENDEKTWISLTTKSDPYIEGETYFTAGLKEDFGSVKIHNISSQVIAKVDFSLPEYEWNKWPIKIGRLLRRATEPHTHLILFINSINKVHFTFSKCGQLVGGIPWTSTRPFILNATQIDAFKVVYNLKCGKPWMDEIIELNIHTDNMHSMGTLEFKLVKEQMEKQEEKLPSMETTAIRIVLFALIFIGICCAAIMIAIHEIAVCLPTYW